MKLHQSPIISELSRKRKIERRPDCLDGLGTKAWKVERASLTDAKIANINRDGS